ncbi:TetR/AcrR family transcriptional regulator [Streptomyces rubellomurinus]|uniref:TetR/AcrR family transcriptional regulator n=1 Tax=Streptomyces sp. Y1 TaxID=3238634 RepID=A0AB39TJP7_9ACTN|nr:TetR/AcrR family transcriptional regulator [Streptomyces rubellomurinus]
MITRAATAVFGREGYLRASMDAIAAEAGVSKRTVYNHFPDKETLFLTVALRSSAGLAEQVRRLMAEHLDRAEDPRRALVGFAVARARVVLAAGEHGAVGRAIRAEVANVPADVLEAWREAGPVATRRDLADRLAALAGRGLLAVDDPERAAERFTLLTLHGVAERSFWGVLPVAEEEAGRIAADGVDAFLRIHGVPAAA